MSRFLKIPTYNLRLCLFVSWESFRFIENLERFDSFRNDEEHIQIKNLNDVIWYIMWYADEILDKVMEVGFIHFDSN